MNGLLLMCSIAILTTVYALPPGLSDSFYMQATATQTINFSDNDVIIEFSRFNVATDTTRNLELSDTVSTTNGVLFYFFSLVSENDNITYTDLNSTCTMGPISSTDIDTNSLFGEFNTGVEDPTGTITYTNTSSGRTNVLVTVNGLPTTLTSTSTSSTFNLDIHSYTNSAPPFSIFVLPDACSNFTCNYCCNTAAGVASSFLLMLAALVMFLFSTV